MYRGKVVFEDEGNEWIKFFQPSDKLKRFVENYFEIKVSNKLNKPLSIIALPNLNTTACILLSNNSLVYKSSIEASYDEYNMSEDKICWSLTHPLIASYMPGAYEFSIKFKPGGFSQIFSTDISNDLDSYSPLNKYISEDFIYNIKSSKSIEERIEITEMFLLNSLNINQTNYKDDTVIKAIDLISSFQINDVYEIAKHLAVSQPTLNRYFKDTLGVSPKQCLKMLRFKVALKKYRSFGSTYLYEQFGYTDFSHFVKDAKRYGNRAPSLL